MGWCLGNENKVETNKVKMVKLAQKTKAGKAKKKSIKKDAKSHLLHAIKINPEFFDAHYELGCMLMDEGDFKNAEKQFKKVVKLAMVSEPLDSIANVPESDPSLVVVEA